MAPSYRGVGEVLLKCETGRLNIPVRNRDRYIPLRLVHRGSESAVKVGYKVGNRTPWMQSHYFNPKAYSTEKGKVILVVAGKGMGKTNLMRNVIQAYYRTSHNPILVFQEKSGDLDFNRTATLGQVKETGIERLRLSPPRNCRSPQKRLVPLGENDSLKLPLGEMDFDKLTEYFGKRISSSVAGMVLERIWQRRENKLDIHHLKQAIENEMVRFEEDPYYNNILLQVNRFLHLLQMDDLLEVERYRSAQLLIHPEQINIVDLSNLGDLDIKRFVVAQMLSLVEKAFRREECFIGITESHIYAPETGDFSSKRELLRLVTVLARSYGWTVFLETQSPDAMERVVLENADEIYVMGYVQRSKLNKLLRTASINFEGFIETYYRVADYIPKGHGVYGSAVDPTNPFQVRLQLSPVG